MSYRRVINGAILVILGLALIAAISTQNWSNLFPITAALVLSLVPYYLKHYHDISISSKLRVSITIFLFCTLFLGEINHFYDTYHWWDTALHFSAGLGITIFGFVILRDIYSQSNLKSTPAMTSFFAFSFTGMMAAVWEIYEFCIDLLDFSEGKMQPSNADTMLDIIIALVAAAIVCTLGYRHLRYNEKNIASEMIEETKVAES